MKERFMLFIFFAIVAIAAIPVHTLAASKTLKPIGYESTYEDGKMHISAASACLGWANTTAMRELKVKISGPPKYDSGGVVCPYTQDGSESSMSGAVYIKCPEHSSQVSLALCACDDDRDTVVNNQCVAQGAVTDPVGATQTPQPEPDNKKARVTPPMCPERTFVNKSGERIIESRLARGTARGGFERQMFSGIEVGLPGWERAHSQGSGTGKESAEAIYYAPKEVNQKWQNCGVEEFLRDLVAAAPKDQSLCLLTATTAYPKTLRLAEIQYKVTALKAGQSPMHVLDASISVENKKVNPKVEPHVGTANIPDNMLKGTPGTKSTRKGLPWNICR